MSLNLVNKNKIQKWILNLSKKNTKNVLLVYGKSGLGKYTTVYNALNEMNYDIHTFHSIDFLNKKDIKEEINKMVNNRSIYMMMNKNKNKNAIIIKELEALNKPHNLRFIIEIINNYFINNSNNIPLVCIASGDFFKKLGDLEKISEKIVFKKTNVKNFRTYINKKLKENNLIVETKLKNYIIKNINSNIRQFNRIIDYMIYNHEDKYKLENYKKIIDMITTNENKEIELYEMMLRILNDDQIDINTMIDFFSVEKIFLPLMINQNYKLKLLYNNKNKLPDYVNVSNIISKSDIIHKYIFDLHYWDLQDSYSILSCYYPYHIIKKINKKIKMEDIKFTSILNKNSFKYATHLNCSKIMRNTKQILNFDYVLLSYYCRYIGHYLLSNNEMDQEKGLEILMINNFDISDVSKIIKFSNYEKYDNIYNKKIYNKLKKIYKNKYQSSSKSSSSKSSSSKSSSSGTKKLSS